MPSDIEMKDVDHQSDTGSGTTPESEFAAQYDVEEILAEKGKNRRKRYLVKWLGYPEYRSSWEPRSSFDNRVPINNWKAKQAKIEAKELPPFDVQAFERDLIRRERETNARRQARRRRRAARQSKKQEALRSTLFPDDDIDENSGQKPSAQNQNVEPPLSWEEIDQQAALFISTDSSYSDGSSNDDSSDEDSKADASIVLADSCPPDASKAHSNTTQPLLISENPPKSATQPSPDVSRAPPGPIQVASKVAQKSQITTSTTNSGISRTPAGQQSSSRKDSTSTTAPSNNTTNAPARPPAALVGFGDPSVAPGRGQTHHLQNTKWHSREARWGRDRAPNVSDVQLFKPSEAASLRNPQTNPGAVSTQVLGEHSSGLGIAASGATSLTTARPHDTSETSQCEPETNTVQAVKSPQISFARTSPKAISPNDGSLALQEQGSRQETSAKDQRQIFQASARRPALDSFRSSKPHSAENRSPLEVLGPTENHNRPLAPPLSPAQGISAASVSSNHNSTMPTPSFMGDQFKDTRAQNKGDHTNFHGGQPSANELISRMPVGKPSKDSLLLPNGHFFNRSEIYAHIYVGNKKYFVGEVRICGMPWKFRSRLMSMKSRGKIDMWFKELCNADQYVKLCDLCHGAEGNKLHATCWMEGFHDTNPELFRLAQTLGQKHIMAICSPPNQRNDVAWLLHSRISPDFDFLVPSNGTIPDSTPLVLSVRASMPPISFLQNSHQERVGMRAPFSIDTAIEFEESPGHTAVVESLPQGRHLNEGFSPFYQNPIGAIQDIFSSQWNITIERLARLKDSSKAENFFLHYPGVGGDDEMNAMRDWLRSYDLVVYTSQDPSGWKRFLRNSRCGVVVFHDSFTDFHSLRPDIGKCVLMHEGFNVWNISLRDKIKRTDSRGLRVDTHSQRLFSSGGLVLISEDIFRDTKITAILVYWFFFFRRDKDNQDWKLILPPNAWKRLQERLQSSKSDEETCLVLSIIAWIKRNNSIDVEFPYFREESLSPNKIDEGNTNIISLPIAGYGSRSENDCPAIPKGLSQQERDMDHLAEAFAGWALTKSDRFRRMFILSSVKLPSLQERWRSWGHLVLYEPDDFFRLFKIREETIMRYVRGEKSSQPSNKSARSTVASQSFHPETPTTPAESAADAGQGDHWKSPSKLNQPNPYK